MAVQAENGRGCHPGGQNSPMTATNTIPTNTDPAKLLDLGPQYIRNRYISMEPGIKRRNRRSAVELLEESKSLYVKSESVLDAKQVPKNADNLQVRQRRSTHDAVDGGSRLSEIWTKSDSKHGPEGSSITSPGSGGGLGSSGRQWPDTGDNSNSSSSSSSSGSSSSGQPTPTAETPATALGGGGVVGIGGVGGALTGTSRLDQCHNITGATNTTGGALGGGGGGGGNSCCGATPTVVQTVLGNKRQRPDSGESTGSSASSVSLRSPVTVSANNAVNQAKEQEGERSKGLKRANSHNCPKCLHLAGRLCEDCCKKRNKNSTGEGSGSGGVVRSSSPVLGESFRDSCGGGGPSSSSGGVVNTTIPSFSASSPVSRPPPPVPPKPLDHQPLQQQQPGARLPPPVPPKHRSYSSSSENAGTIPSNTTTTPSDNTPPPVPPKPGDRSSFYQEKLPPPPVLPKPCNPSSGSGSKPGPPVAPKRASYNGMEGNPSTDGRSKSSMESNPHHTGSQSTPPPVPPKPKPSLMASDAWRDAHTDTSSEIDQHSNSSLVKVDDKLVVVRRRPRKFHRSRSDLTKRFSNSSDLSELSARFSRNSADLEKFFNEMGLDRSVLEPMMMNACQRSASDLHLFESASSIESPDIRSWCSDDDVENPLKHEAVEERTPPVGQSSIVERNARIIKWLCSVKKAASHEEPLTEQ